MRNWFVNLALTTVFVVILAYVIGVFILDAQGFQWLGLVLAYWAASIAVALIEFATRWFVFLAWGKKEETRKFKALLRQFNMPTDASDFDVESYLAEVRGRQKGDDIFVSVEVAKQAATAAEMTGLLDANKIASPLTSGVMLSMAWTEAVSEFVNRH